MQKMVWQAQIAPQTTEIQIDDHLLSTPFASIIGKKEYCFFPIIEPKVVDIKVDINLYLWCLWSNLGVWHHFLYLQNLRDLNLILAHVTECDTIFCIYRISGIQIWYWFVQQNAAMRTKTHFKTPFVSLVSLVQSGHVTPFFASTESQKSKSDIIFHSIPPQSSFLAFDLVTIVI